MIGTTVVLPVTLDVRLHEEEAVPEPGRSAASSNTPQKIDSSPKRAQDSAEDQS